MVLFEGSTNKLTELTARAIKNKADLFIGIKGFGYMTKLNHQKLQRDKKNNTCNQIYQWY
jgi:hypothetical protein